MADSLNFVLPVPSLQHMALVKLGTSLIYSAIENDVITFKKDNSLGEMKNMCDILLSRAKGVIPQNQKDYSERWFQSILLNYHDVYNELYDILSHSAKVLMFKDIFRHFVPSCRGKVDPVETCKNITRDENLDLVFRFRLSCKYYLEQPIQALWKQMQQEDFHNFEVATIMIFEEYEVTLWSLKMLDLEDEMVTFLEPDPEFSELSLNALAFKRELERGNQYGTKHFVQKLKVTEKVAVLDQFHFDSDLVHNDQGHIHSVSVNNANMLYLSLLSPAQLKIFFKEHGVRDIFYVIMMNSLNELVPQIFESLRSYIDEACYFKILIGVTISCDFLWDVPIFDVMWTHDAVPDSYREYVLSSPGEDGAAYLLDNLISHAYDPSFQRSVDLVLRCANKDHLRIIIAGLVENLKYHDQDEFQYSDQIKLLQRCARKMICSKEDLDFVQMASSPILDHEQRWQVFLWDMSLKLELND